jgi:hypothetical protein
MPRLLSRVASPTPLLYVFLAVTQAAYGFYIARGASLPPAFVLLYPFAFLWAVGWWLRSDSRKRGVAWVFDMGLFLYVAWPFVLPYYLFKTRGAGAVLTILAFAGVYVAASVLGAVLGLITI